MNFPRIAALLLAPLAVPVLGGCIFIKQPEPLAVPPLPKPPTGVQFDPADGAPKGTALNDPSKPALPSAFRTALVVSGQEVVLQTVQTKTGPDGKKQVILGVGDTLNPVRVAGIVVPTGTQTGAAEAAATLNNWTAGQDLDVQIDPVYPTDTDNKRRVAIFFHGRTEATKGTLFSLNRMMVRSGYALVDLYSPTSFDQKQWLLDETYARENNLGLWKTDTFRVLQQRVKLPSRATGAQSKVGLEQPLIGAPAGAPVTGAPTDGSANSAATSPASAVSTTTTQTATRSASASANANAASAR